MNAMPRKYARVLFDEYHSEKVHSRASHAIARFAKSRR